jgi:putative DNA primase/helicase
VCLADVEAHTVPWLWNGRIPLGRLTLLVGRPGCGKSFLTCDLAARISTHTHWPDPGFDRAPLGDPLLICAEDDPADTIRPRLDAARANCRRVHLLKAAKVLADNGNERSVAFDLSNVDLIRDALDRLPATVPQPAVKPRDGTACGIAGSRRCPADGP